jgi:hypothetical protein
MERRRDALPLLATTREELRLLGTLDGLTHAELSGDFDEDDITTALAGHPVICLRLEDTVRIRDLAFLGRFESLRELQLSGTSANADLASLVGVPLRELRVNSYADATPAWQGLRTLDSLTSFRLEGWPELPSLAHLPARAALHELALLGGVPDLTGVARWRTTLRSLALPERELALDECRAIADLPHLTGLSLHPVSLRSLESHGIRLPQVTFAHVTGDDDEGDLRHVAAVLPRLTALTLRDVLGDLAPLTALGDLRSVEIFGDLEDDQLHNLPPQADVTRTHRPSRY